MEKRKNKNFHWLSNSYWMNDLNYRFKVLTGKNLDLLKNNGQNLLCVNLKNDAVYGEFYGFKEIYGKIIQIFPGNFLTTINEGIHLNSLNELFDFIFINNFFFLKNCSSQEDFLEKINSKIDKKLKISSGIASISGIIPIPFVDIPVIIGLEVDIIKYIAKILNIDDSEYNTFHLLSRCSENVFSKAYFASTASKLTLSLHIVDLIPIAGCLISAAINPATINLFGYSIKKFFYRKVNYKKLIKGILKDYRSIYLQISELSNRNNFDIE